MSWNDCTAGASDYTGFQTSAADNVTVQDTGASGTTFWHVTLDFNVEEAITYPQQLMFPQQIPLLAPGPCEDDRPLTEDSWRCPECEHLHGRRHYKNWKDGPPYCPHCKTEFESWDKITFLEQKEIDRLNRERRWTRDD